MAIDYKTPYHWNVTGMSKEIQDECLHYACACLNKNAKALDLGCGDGFFTHSMKLNGFSMVGVDVSQSGLRWAKLLSGNGIDYVRATGTLLPFRDEVFNEVISFEVIEHVSKQKAALMVAEMWRVLKPRGAIIISTPNKKNIRNRIRHRQFTSAKHLYEYEIDELRELFAKFGEVEIIGLGIYLPIFGLTRWGRRFLIWLGKLLPFFSEKLIVIGEKRK